MKLAEAIILRDHNKGKVNEIYKLVHKTNVGQEKIPKRQLEKYNKEYLELKLQIMDLDSDISYTEHVKLFNKNISLHEAAQIKDAQIKKLYDLYEVEKEARFININYKNLLENDFIDNKIKILGLVDIWVEIARLSEIIRKLTMDIEKIKWDIDLLSKK